MPSTLRRALAGLGVWCALAALASPARGQLALGQPPGRWGGVAVAFAGIGTEPNLLMGVVAADRGPLHLEARYQYEELDTVSGWVGWAFTGGRELQFGIGPMAGGVVGQLNGVAPGLRLAAQWRRFAFYAESEYVVALGGSGTSFFYNWSTWSWTPRDWLAVGVSVQRLRLADTGRWVESGPMLALSFGRATVQGFVFNPFSSDTYGLVGALLFF